MRHPEYEAKIDAYLLGRLIPEEISRFEEHYFNCPYCFRLTAERATLLKAVKVAGPGLSASIPSTGKQSIRTGSTLRRFPFRWAVAGAAVLILAIVVSVLPRRDPKPPVFTSSGSETVRGEMLRIIAPQGLISAAPAKLDWQAVTGAAEYTIIVEGIDPIWTATTREISIEIPTNIAGRFLPGKSYTWRVKAFAAEGPLLASSLKTAFTIVR